MPKNDKQQIWDSYYFWVDGGKEENAIGEDSWTLFVSLYFNWLTVSSVLIIFIISFSTFETFHN